MSGELDENLINIWESGKFPSSSLILSQNSLEVDRQKIKKFFSHIVSKFSNIPIENLSEIIIVDLERDSAGKLANNISVAQVREIQNYLSIKNLIIPYRFVAIFSADKMNINASNSLLKILEDTPEDTYIILIASDKNKLSSTIKSRLVEIYSQDLHNINLENYSDIYKILNPEVRFQDKLPIIEKIVKSFGSEDVVFIQNIVDAFLMLMKKSETDEIEYKELINYIKTKEITETKLNKFVTNSVDLISSIKQYSLDPKQCLLYIIADFLSLHKG